MRRDIELGLLVAFVCLAGWLIYVQIGDGDADRTDSVLDNRAGGDTRSLRAGAILPDFPTPTATSAPAPSSRTASPKPTPERMPQPEPASIIEQFLAGYRAGGGNPQYEAHLVHDVIPCESEWQLDPENFFLGLAQFHPQTWNTAKCSADAAWWNAYDQGCAVAYWMLIIAPNWGTTAGWPVCWWRGL